MASNTYILASGSTFKGAAIPSGTAVSWGWAGNPTSMSSDGSRSVNLTVVDNKSASITVESYDASFANSANFIPGAQGSLILKTKLRGAGDSTSTSLTITFAECVLISTQSSAPNDGAGGITLSFSAYDSNDDNSLVAYS